MNAWFFLANINVFSLVLIEKAQLERYVFANIFILRIVNIYSFIRIHLSKFNYHAEVNVIILSFQFSCTIKFGF